MTKVGITSAYKTQRVNRTTFLIMHNDVYEELPFIYIKLYDIPALAIVIDTGCGNAAAAVPKVHISDLIDFIETYPNADNGFQPLNPRSRRHGDALVGHRRYLVICSHVHFDHIGGIESFPSHQSQVWASGRDKDFLSLENRERNSLCLSVGMPLPQYQVSRFVQDFERLEFEGVDLGLNFIHTPGHTPDSLTLWDENERWLYTGDSFYYLKSNVFDGIPYEQAIIFPPQGSLSDYMDSLKKVEEYVNYKNTDNAEFCRQQHILIGCAHTTSGVEAIDMLQHVRSFFEAVIDGKIPVQCRQEKYGEIYATWHSDRNGQSHPFILSAPERLLFEYKTRPEL